MTRIVVTRRPPGNALDRLSDLGELWLWPEDRAIPRKVLEGEIAGATGLYCMLVDPIDSELLAAAPLLVAVSTMAVGVDNIDLAACTARGIPVGHTPDVLTETVADTAFGLIIAAARRFSEGIDHVRRGLWGPWEPDLLLGHDIHRATLGIIGYGRVGQAVARRAVGFDMEILYWSRTPKPDTAASVGARWTNVDELLELADHVVVSTALTPDTTAIIDAAALARMKPTATLTNISRGGTVDTDALVTALQGGEIAAAALDVTDPEPLPADHPLLGLPNCTVIPHLGSSSRQTREAMAKLAAENLRSAILGRRMPAVANPEVYEPED